MGRGDIERCLQATRMTSDDGSSDTGKQKENEFKTKG